MGGGGGSSKFEQRGLKSVHGGSMGGVKMLSKNTCEGGHLIVKLSAGYKPVSLQIY